MRYADIFDLAARLAVAFYFLWATWFNIGARAHHLAEFRRIGMPAGGFFFVVGLLAQGLGSVLLLYPPTVLLGAVVLIAFTAAADAMFHRYWTYSDPGERTVHQFFLFEHVALIGGIISIASRHTV